MRRANNATNAARWITAAALIATVVLLAILKANAPSAPIGVDPCASGAAPQVCEAQRSVDLAHARENAEAEVTQP